MSHFLHRKCGVASLYFRDTTPQINNLNKLLIRGQFLNCDNSLSKFIKNGFLNQDLKDSKMIEANKGAYLVETVFIPSTVEELVSCDPVRRVGPVQVKMTYE